MANVGFLGLSALTLDPKGRITIPTRHRELLTALGGPQVTITRGTQGCLWLFPRQPWERFRDEIIAKPMSEAKLKRHFLGHAMELELDNQARLVIPPELRELAGLDKDAMLMGVGTHFEIWDAARKAEPHAELSDDAMFTALGDVRP